MLVCFILFFCSLLILKNFSTKKQQEKEDYDNDKGPHSINDIEDELKGLHQKKH